MRSNCSSFCHCAMRYELPHNPVLDGRRQGLSQFPMEPDGHEPAGPLVLLSWARAFHPPVAFFAFPEVANAKICAFPGLSLKQKDAGPSDQHMVDLGEFIAFWLKHHVIDDYPVSAVTKAMRESLHRDASETSAWSRRLSRVSWLGRAPLQPYPAGRPLQATQT